MRFRMKYAKAWNASMAKPGLKKMPGNVPAEEEERPG
jgi:hypothetical protein